MGFSASAAFLLAGWGGLSVALALLVVGAVAAVAGALLRHRWQGRAAAIVGVTIVVAMGAFWQVEKRTFQPLEAYAGKTLSLTMEITDHPTNYARSARYTARVTQGDLPTGTRLTLWITSADVRPQPYDRLSGQVALFPLEEDAAQRRQDKAEGIVLSGSLRIGESVTVQTPTQKPWGAALLSVRQAAAGLVERYLSGEPAALVKSLCLGDRSVLSGAIKDDFRACGVSHLLVVSGLHLSMIAGAVQALLRLLRCRRRPAAVITMLAVIAFMLLVGFTPSVKRAGVMLLVLLAGELFRREADGLNSLGLALLLIGLLDPYMVWDIGLQLSAGSTAGILLLYPRMQRGWLLSVQQSSHAWVRTLYRPAQMVAVSLSAMLVLPLLILYFGEISLVFLPANLLMVYPATGAVVVGLLGLVCGGWCAPAGTLLFGAAGLLARLLRWIAGWIGRLPLATVQVRQPYVWLGLLLVAVVLGLFWKHLTRKTRVCAVTGAVIALAAGVLTYQALMRPVTTCEFLETEGDTAALMQWSGGNALILTGEEDATMRQVTAALSRQRIRRLSVVVLLNLNDKALANLPVLANACEIERVICPSSGRYAPSVRSLFAEDACTMAEHSVVTVGEQHRFELNNGWLQAAAGDTRFLFAPADGDAAALPDSWKQVHLAALPKTVTNADQITAAVRAGDTHLLVTTRGRQDIASKEEAP